MDQLTDKPVSVDEMYDKAVGEAKTAPKKPYKIRKKKPQPDTSGETFIMPITEYTASRKRIAFKAIFDQDIGDKIVTFVMLGYTIRNIALMEDMPSEGTIQWWLINNPRFKSLYARACVYRADQFEEEIISLSDQASRSQDPYEIRGLEVKIKTLQWIMGRSLRKKWGDHVTVDVTPVDLSAMDEETTLTFMKLLDQMGKPKA